MQQNINSLLKLYGGKVEGGLAAYEDIARAFGKTQAYTEMWAAIGRSLKKGEMPSIDSMIQGNKVEVREGKFTAGFFNQELEVSVLNLQILQERF